MGHRDPVEIHVDQVRARTDKAVLCEIDGNEYWLPISQTFDGGAEPWSPEVGDTDITVEIPQWLAEEKGLE